MKTWRVIDLIEWTTDYFKHQNIPSPRLDAELLLGHVLKKSRLQLYLCFDMPVLQEALAKFRGLIKRRATHTPVSYLTNQKDFMSLTFYVDSRVLIPRPETEILVETVLQQQSGKCRIIDIGTGSGAIAVSLAFNRPDWEIVATDMLVAPLDVARKNACIHGCTERITFLQGDVFAPLESLENRRFDWIASNPPYISAKDFPTLPPDIRDHEPSSALTAGCDGLSIIRQLIADAPQHLNPNGRLILEVGDNQSGQVQDLIRLHPAYNDCQMIVDYSGRERIIVASL